MIGHLKFAPFRPSDALSRRAARCVRVIGRGIARPSFGAPGISVRDSCRWLKDRGTASEPPG